MAGGPSNFTFGLKLSAIYGESNATFAESWANAGILVQDSWVMQISTGDLSGPYTTQTPESSSGGLAQGHSAPFPPLVILLFVVIAAIGITVAFAAYAYHRRARRGNRP